MIALMGVKKSINMGSFTDSKYNDITLKFNNVAKAAALTK